MRRWLFLVVFVAICSLAAMSSASAEIACSCSMEKCICFIQMGDEGIAVKGIMDRLYEEGYLQSANGSMFDESVYEAICLFQRENSLEETGLVDDNTLSLLIWGLSADEMEESAEVWVPTDGGKKRHRKPTCSGMKDPRVMSSLNAQGLGIEACKRCKPE